MRQPLYTNSLAGFVESFLALTDLQYISLPFSAKISRVVAHVCKQGRHCWGYRTESTLLMIGLYRRPKIFHVLRESRLGNTEHVRLQALPVLLAICVEPAIIPSRMFIQEKKLNLDFAPLHPAHVGWTVEHPSLKHLTSSVSPRKWAYSSAVRAGDS